MVVTMVGTSAAVPDGATGNSARADYGSRLAPEFDDNDIGTREYRHDGLRECCESRPAALDDYGESTDAVRAGGSPGSRTSNRVGAVGAIVMSPPRSRAFSRAIASPIPLLPDDVRDALTR